MKVFRVGKSEEGRDFLLIAVSDEANIAQLEHSKEITARLADPRKIAEADAQRLISSGKPFYWASGSIHSPETGSPEMLMELAYRLAVEDTPLIQNIRKNMVFLITPIVEVDGHDRAVDWANYRKAYPDKPAARLGLLGTLRPARQQSRLHRHGSQAIASHDEEFSRMASAGTS